MCICVCSQLLFHTRWLPGVYTVNNEQAEVLEPGPQI